MTNLRDFQLLLLLAMIMLGPIFFSVPVAARSWTTPLRDHIVTSFLARATSEMSVALGW